MSTSRVFFMKYWIQEEERPWIDFNSPENQPQQSWLKIGRILNCEEPLDSYCPFSLVVPEERATEWQSYEIAGTYGMLSTSVIDMIGVHMSQYFDFLPAFVNEQPYYTLRPKRFLNCFDWKNSTFETFPGRPNSIMRIEKHRFIKNDIPDSAVFGIPEMRWQLFATDSIQQALSVANFKGIYMIDTGS
jgi:hypothetical protein